MQTIGFIGASGLMGHGMAKNLRAKGHPLAITAFRKRDRVADLLAAGAKELPNPAAMARECSVVFLCVTGSPQVEAVVAGPDGLLSGAARRAGHRRHLDQRARLHHAHARAVCCQGRQLHRFAAGAHAGGGRGRQAQRDGRRQRGGLRAHRAAAEVLCREHLPCRRPRRRSHHQAAQQLHRAGGVQRHRRGLRGRPARRRRSEETGGAGVGGAGELRACSRS